MFNKKQFFTRRSEDFTFEATGQGPGTGSVRKNSNLKFGVSLAALAFCLLFFAFPTFAQNRTVTGTVTASDDGSTLPGVNVLVKGTTSGTTTDGNGKFSISVPGNDATLVFSFIGYTAEEVAVGARSVIDVGLVPDVQSLQEVVVTGYTTENRRDVTGAVATVKARDLVAVPSGNVEQQLQGRVPGVTVITNGQPGTTSVVRLRGFGAFGGNEPLYVVDGVPVGSTDFLNPDDIETTTVLKDAPSASIYGARAANGVIVYTTKKGYDGKMRVTYDGVFGVSTPGKVNNILNPQEQADWTWQAKRNTAQQLGYAPGSELYNNLFKTDQYGNDPAGPVLPDYLMVGNRFGVVGNINLDEERAKYNNDPRLGSVYLVMPADKNGTNWYDALTRPALLNRHTLGFSGGSERSKYYISLGMQNQQGVLIHQKFERYAMRLNSEHNLAKGVRFGQTLQGTYIRRQGLVGGNGGRGAAGEENNWLDAFRMPAIIPVYDAFGGYAGTQAKGFNNPRNPVAARDRSSDNGGFGYGLFGNFYVEVDPIKDLTLRSSIGGGLSSGFSNFYSLPSYENSENQSAYSYGENYNWGANWVFTNTARYNKKFGIHTIDLLGGIESLNTGFGRNIGGNGQSPFSRDPNYVTLTTTGNRVVNSGYNRGITFFSIFGQAKYIFNDKYIFTGVLRRDGASSFGPENRYGVFPAASAAWRISSEDFMSGVPFINDLKIRGGYGMMGNTSGLSSSNQFSLFAADLGSSFYDITGGNAAPEQGFFRNRIGNPAAKWETSITSNIGFDGSFFDGKLDVVFDVWRKDTRDLLYSLETAAVIGPQATDPAINIAKMRNEGIDIGVTTRGTRGADFNYEVTLSASFLNNEIVALAPGVEYFEPFTLRNITPIRNQVGRSISAFYGYDVVGLFQNQAEVDAAPTQDGKAVGRFRYRDINGDGAITVDDRTYLGSPVPKFNGGINIKLGYKNFEFETFLQTFLGVQNYNFSKWYNNFYPSFTGTAYSTAVKESFTFERGGNTVPIFEDASNFSTNTQSNSFYIESGNYARLTNLQLAYKLPESMMGRYGFSRARVYLQATNLFTISKYSGLDPGVAGNADTTLGIDVGNPPMPRGYNIGLNLTF
ncbi:SusC/RagA family TonB-linked outer membrane protein [Rhodocytophaga aerolata]|uniref:SusC/RagA family TonB-linked outer membrane protein n=1 Tax=Rhodocytophaga aerolata TaxID=455078 RepID=A0ABT8RAK0_9BACT|nr:SusC/RagA family TonB-linked outer membrane protein [Rhodocytophaga aerolata]MDO1448706.1 SusC/RagA family TonB-linked outer membrane protein [Rhodocytophaga aerolata]